ncbi:MAG: hypothetical protein K8W52_29270 [Deltaproteobacteria bacterium]|nr:hypothetical protein [Deltaproteobacteria bacterium]
MVTDDDAAAAALAGLFEVMTDETMAVAASAVARAIRACAHADALEALLQREHVVDLFGNGIGTLPLWPPIIDAMVALADAMPAPGDAARVLGWARWACGASPTELVRPDLAPSLVPAHRAACLPAFAAHAPLYRRWLGDGSAERRAAGAHALAWCADASEDLELVLAAARAEPDGAALGSALVTVGVLAHRRGDAGADAVRALAHAALDHPEAFARAGAAVASALLGETLSAAATRALTDVAITPFPLPAGWGWRTPGKVSYASDALACAVLGWAPTVAADDAVRALAAIAPPDNPAGAAFLEALRAQLGEQVWRDAARARPQHAGPGEALIASALAHLAFAARDRPAPADGLVAAELDPIQRLAIEAMGRREPSAEAALRRVGLYAQRGEDLVPAFLDGTAAEWRPMTIVVDGLARRWHFGPVWGATIAGRLSVEAACDAIHAAMTPSEAVDLVTRFTAGRMIAYERITDAAAWAIDQALALAVIDAAVARGFELDEMMRAVAANPRTGLPAIAAVAYLRARDTVPAEFRALVERGVAEARVAEPLRTLVARAAAP